MDKITHTTYRWPLPGGAEFRFSGDEASAQYIDAAFKDAARWRKALSAYERGVVMSHDGSTGEVDGYISLFLQAIRERDAAK